MIEINCNICGEEIWSLGALLFSPPEHEDVKKFHICITCYKELMKYIEELKKIKFR